MINPLLSIWYEHIDGLVQNCSNPMANALELLQSCIKPSILCAIDRVSCGDALMADVAHIIQSYFTGLTFHDPSSFETSHFSHQCVCGGGGGGGILVYDVIPNLLP